MADSCLCKLSLQLVLVMLSWSTMTTLSFLELAEKAFDPTAILYWADWRNARWSESDSSAQNECKCSWYFSSLTNMHRSLFLFCLKATNLFLCCFALVSWPNMVASLGTFLRWVVFVMFWLAEEDKADRRRGGKTTSGNGQVWSSPSPREQWRTEKWRKLVVKSPLVPLQLSYWWRWKWDWLKLLRWFTAQKAIFIRARARGSWGTRRRQKPFHHMYMQLKRKLDLASVLCKVMQIKCHDSLSKTILLGTLGGGWCHGRQRKCWLDNVKEWTSLPMLELLTMASHGEDWKRISAQLSSVSPQQPSLSRDWTALNWMKIIRMKSVPSL